MHIQYYGANATGQGRSSGGRWAASSDSACGLPSDRHAMRTLASLQRDKVAIMQRFLGELPDGARVVFSDLEGRDPLTGISAALEDQTCQTSALPVLS